MNETNIFLRPRKAKEKGALLKDWVLMGPTLIDARQRYVAFTRTSLDFFLSKDQPKPELVIPHSQLVSIKYV